MGAGLKVVTAGLFALMLCGTAQTQMSGTESAIKSEVFTSTPAAQVDDLLNVFEQEMMGVVKAMPADKFNFVPSSATFAAGSSAKFGGVRSFSAEATHVAEANYYFYGAVSGLKPDVDTTKIESLTKKDDVVDALAKSFIFAHKAIAMITQENALTPIKPVDGMKTRLSLAAFGVAHGYDHYGQMVEYLRMNGIVPPGSK